MKTNKVTNQEKTRRGGRIVTQFLALFILTSLLTSCIRMEDPEVSQLESSETISTILLGQVFTQTFESRHPWVNGIHLWLSCDEDIGTLKIAIHNEEGSIDPIASAEIDLRNISDGVENRIDFPKFGNTPNQDYYLTIETTGSPVELLGTTNDYYSEGTAYLDGQAIQGDLAFRTKYNYGFNSLLEDLSTLFNQSLWILIFLFLILIPGLVILNLGEKSSNSPKHIRLGISISLSLVLFPLIFVWASFFNIPINRLSVFSALLLFAILFFLINHSRLTWKGLSGFFNDPIILILILIFISTYFVRLGMVRDLVSPPWVDSIHHGVITNMILETGLLPEQYPPVLSTDIQYYHSGFHINLAIFQWLNKLDLPTGMLLYGQLLNAAMIFAVYSITRSLTGDNKAALAASLISGFITPMPAYYTSWGRYTQLIALLLLPGSFFSFKYLLTEKSNHTKWMFLSSMLFAGLFLTHYRVFVFALLLSAAYLVINFHELREFQNIKSIILVIFGSIVLTLPWLIPTVEQLILPKAQQWSGGTISWFDGFAWRFLTSGLGQLSLVFAGLGLIIGLLKKQKWTPVIILWVMFLFISANLAVLRLPFSGFINNLSVEIMLFIPISTLGGYLISQLLELNSSHIPTRWQFIGRFIIPSSLIILAILGAKEQLPSLNSTTFLTRIADIEAIQWIDNHIEEGAFLLNPTGWGYGLYMGEDGGYWIAPMTLNKTIPPPVIYGLGTRETKEEINLIVNSVIENQNNPDRIWEIMRDSGSQYLYIGKGGGILKPTLFLKNPKFETIYNQQGVWIFKRMES